MGLFITDPSGDYSAAPGKKGTQVFPSMDILKFRGISALTDFWSAESAYLDGSGVLQIPDHIVGSKFLSSPSSGLNAAITTDGGAYITATVSGGAVTALTIVNGGKGYTSAPTVTFVGGSGTGASVTLAVSGGVVTGYTSLVGGTGYVTAPVVNIGQGAGGAIGLRFNSAPYLLGPGSVEKTGSYTWVFVVKIVTLNGMNLLGAKSGNPYSRIWASSNGGINSQNNTTQSLNSTAAKVVAQRRCIIAVGYDAATQKMGWSFDGVFDKETAYTAGGSAVPTNVSFFSYDGVGGQTPDLVMHEIMGFNANMHAAGNSAAWGQVIADLKSNYAIA